MCSLLLGETLKKNSKAIYTCDITCAGTVSGRNGDSVAAGEGAWEAGNGDRAKGTFFAPCIPLFTLRILCNVHLTHFIFLNETDKKRNARNNYKIIPISMWSLRAGL